MTSTPEEKTVIRRNLDNPQSFARRTSGWRSRVWAPSKLGWVNRFRESLSFRSDLGAYTTWGICLGLQFSVSMWNTLGSLTYTGREGRREGGWEIIAFSWTSSCLCLSCKQQSATWPSWNRQEGLVPVYLGAWSKTQVGTAVSASTHPRASWSSLIQPSLIFNRLQHILKGSWRFHHPWEAVGFREMTEFHEWGNDHLD